MSKKASHKKKAAAAEQAPEAPDAPPAQDAPEAPIDPPSPEAAEAAEAGGPTLLQRLYARIFPKVPDFFALLAEQCYYVSDTADLLVDYMGTGDKSVAKKIKRDEHEADLIKVRNLHSLNEAFSTPIDREDIHRAITTLDDVINYCKSTVNEMDILGVPPDKYTLEMAIHLRDGLNALTDGYKRLKSEPAGAFLDAANARRAERKVEKIYRRALAELFQGDDYLGMFKHREIYRHLSNAADRMADCANTLHDIVVKIT